MIDSIDIKNFRNLDGLRIASFSRVNLIIGKNNTGKSTLLEAIALLVSKGDMNFIIRMLDERGEGYQQITRKKTKVDTYIKSFASLFTNRVVGFTTSNVLSIGILENSLFGSQASQKSLIALRFVRYIDDLNSKDSTFPRQMILFDDSDNNQIADYEIGLELRIGDEYPVIFSFYGEKLNRFAYSNPNNEQNFQFVRTRNIDREINAILWDSITLTEKEQFVIDALKIIEPNVERIAFIEEGVRTRKAVIKIVGNNSVLPLQSMGDGINRILTIILALVNADNGYLLIDEFENGLHHTVQENLWKVIFYLAERLNIQVFATTHSEDCIRGFENILNTQENSEGKLIRLDNVDGKIVEVEFDANEMRIANENSIEIR